MYNITTEYNPLKADYCCGRGNSKPNNGYYRSNKYYPKALVRVLLDRSHNNEHLVFLTKDKHMMCPYSKRLIPQSWNTSNGIS
jgi:hypothetical protein